MATWTPPVTWTVGQVPAAADFNTQISANLTLLKTSIGNDGKIIALTSAYFDSLSGSNLTNVGVLGSVNTWTAKNVFSGGGRVVAPVDSPSYAGTVDGDLSVVGQYLYWRDGSGNKYKYLGFDTGNAPAGAKKGSIWVDTDSNLHYIDSSGEHRYCTGVTTSMHNDSAAKAGSLWVVSAEYLHWIGYSGAQEYQGHADSHSDAGHADSHSDVGHNDSHTDTHTDTSHNDSHSDVAHGAVSHVDVAHTDIHNDNFGGADPPASHIDSHTDVAHSDTSHTDNAHTDSHNDV